MITGIILAAVVVGIVGILIGVFLGVASEKFKVEVDEREVLVREELPGNNCGGCGYAGCDALAKAIAAGEAAVDACPVGGAAVAEKIGAIMGVSGGKAEKTVAFESVRVPVTRPRLNITILELMTAARLLRSRAMVQKPVLMAVWDMVPALRPALLTPST